MELCLEVSLGLEMTLFSVQVYSITVAGFYENRDVLRKDVTATLPVLITDQLNYDFVRSHLKAPAIL